GGGLLVWCHGAGGGVSRNSVPMRPQLRSLILFRIFSLCYPSSWPLTAAAAAAALRRRLLPRLARLLRQLARPIRLVAGAARAAPIGKAYSHCAARRDRDGCAPRDSRPSRGRAPWKIARRRWREFSHASLWRRSCPSG